MALLVTEDSNIVTNKGVEQRFSKNSDLLFELAQYLMLEVVHTQYCFNIHSDLGYGDNDNKPLTSSASYTQIYASISKSLVNLPCGEISNCLLTLQHKAQYGIRNQ